jgi:hypothetical protein
MKYYGKLKAKLYFLYRNARVKGRNKKNLPEELSIEDLNVNFIGRKIKVMKIVYSQEVNKIMKSMESGAGTNGLQIHI